MKITYDWLKDHLKISAKEDKLLEKLTDIGLEVESIENLSEGLDLFKVAKIIKTEKHPNADRLKVCDVDVGNKEIKKVVCGAANAREGLLTVYAPPGAIIPKNKTKLVVAKIRDVTSYGMMKVMGLLSFHHPNMQKILEKVIFLSQVLILSIYQLHQIDQTASVFVG
jgi:phenylalanyl-tRNA synthetase beta chain